MTTNKKVPSLLISLLPILFLVVLLAVNVILYGESSSYGPNQIALLLAAAFTGVLGLKLGYKWEDLQDGMVKSISSAMAAILILFMIGVLSGTWLISGIVPAMIYYGLDILNPTIFLFAACVVSAIVSLATGSSWTTAATVGIALIGIGKAMGIHEGVVAGAVISGAYFGDKMSPLSDTTNLAPAMAGTDLITHIRYMALTTGPSIVITLIILLVWGFTLDTTTDVAQASIVQEAITSKFNIHLRLFLVPAAVVFLIIKKVPALPALLIGSLLGGVFALIFQPQLINEISGISDNRWKSSYAAVLKAMFTETSVVTGNLTVDDLLKAKGMEGMLNTIWLIMTAMVFGGVMECTGMLKKLAHSIIKLAQSTGSLVASTAATCITFNVTASDQYIAIVVPGRMFTNTYKERGLAPENLSRTLEDSGTVTSVLIPWNTCGAYQSGVLGVATLAYLPYCFFNIISPFMTILYAYLNIKIRKLDKPSEPQKNVTEKNPEPVESV